MNDEFIASQMQALLQSHLPPKASFTYSIFDARPKINVFEMPIDPQPFEGKVVAVTERLIVVRKGRKAEFAVLDRTLVTDVPAEGDQVAVEPYARRRFDGLRADTPQAETRIDSQGQPYTVETLIIGSAPAKLPIPAPRCPELQALIRQLEEMPAPDGYRHIAHLLVDANARDFTWVDPKPKDIIKTPPSIGFSVDTAKFQGRVTVRYKRGPDHYAIELSRDGERVEQVDRVYADDLGRTLERLIDDGHWQRIQVRRLPGKKATRH